jgi:WD40-like Beta Propeller Repeat
MTTLEDRLRAALRETAGDITPHSVPPLRLPGGGRRPGRPAGAGRRRWPAWLTPLAAAASVVAVVAASLVIATAFHGRQRPATHGPAGPFAGVPPYYVALAVTNPRLRPTIAQRQFAEIRATATGAVLAVVTAPKPYGTFSAVAGNGHSFVLAANKWKVRRQNGYVTPLPSQTRFFLLQIGRGGRATQLTALPIPPEPADADISFALTPDGSKLAVGLRGGVNGGPGPAIQVFSLATGAERVWTWPGGGPITNNGGNGEVLSWTADGRTLAFQQWAGNSIDVRLLDTATAGGSLRADSRLAVQWRDDAETLHYVHGRVSNAISGVSAIITGDGTRIVAATVSETKHPLSSELAFTEFSARTGRVTDVRGRWPIPGLYPGQIQDVLWANSSGSTLIVLAHTPGTTVKPFRHSDVAAYGIEFGVLTGNRFVPLPGAPRPGITPWPVW